MSKEDNVKKAGRPPKTPNEKKGPGLTIYLLPAELKYLQKVQRREGNIARSPAVSKIIEKAIKYDDLIAKRIEDTKNATLGKPIPPTPLETLGKLISELVTTYAAVKLESEKQHSIALLQDKEGKPDA